MSGERNISKTEYLPRVSVIIPTYNQPNLLQSAVESVLTQTYPNIEIIVVDEGCTDDTAEMMVQYEGRVTYVKQVNSGVSAARNLGIQIATGEYIGFLDQDDLFSPTKIERQVQVLDSHPEIGLVHCQYYHVDLNGAVLDKIGTLPETDILKELLYGCFIVSHAPLVRRQSLEDVGVFDTTLPWRGQYAEDWDLWLRLVLAGHRFACIQEPLCAYRILSGSAVGNIAELEQGTFAVLDKTFANPQLPADILAIKNEAYGLRHCWISWRYYADNRWEQAQQSLSKALSLHTELLTTPPKLLLQLIRDNALNLRIGDPRQFIDNVFDHLPPQAEFLHPYRSQLLSQVLTELALRSYANGNVAEARQQLTKAITLDQTILKDPVYFESSICHNAVCLPVDSPFGYIDRVFKNLPPEAYKLKPLQAQIVSKVSIGRAFENHQTGRPGAAIQQILTALWHHPTWIKNKGVVSILLKSLRTLPTKGL